MTEAFANHSTVIVRLDRTIQYAAADGFTSNACDYWIPAFAGMTSRGE